MEFSAESENLTNSTRFEGKLWAERLCISAKVYANFYLFLLILANCADGFRAFRIFLRPKKYAVKNWTKSSYLISNVPYNILDIFTLFCAIFQLIFPREPLFSTALVASSGLGLLYYLQLPDEIGSFVVIIGKMLKEMLKFVVVLLTFSVPFSLSLFVYSSQNGAPENPLMSLYHTFLIQLISRPSL